jgi:pyruvate dehydrogenase E1 component beta subunit
MPVDILMPALSPTMEQGKLAKWLKKEGDRIKSGDILAEIETDKATMEVEAVDEGILARIIIADGTDNVAVNTVIAVITAEGEDVNAASAAAVPSPVAAAATPAAVTAPVATSATVHAAPISYDASSEYPAGTEMVMTTVRDALRDAMAEEMRRDGDVFVMGEEVAE